MNQIMKETPQEVKREIPAESQERDFQKFPRWLYGMTNEDCYGILRSVARIEHYPYTYLTHPTEVARFLGIPKERWRSFRAAYIHHDFPSRIYPDDFPILHKWTLMNTLKQRAEENGVTLIESYAADGSMCISPVGSPAMQIEVGTKNTSYTKFISMRGVLALAVKLAGTNGCAYPREIANKVLEASFKWLAKKGEELERNKTPDELPPETPESPTPEPPKMDYAETLRKLFDSVLTLVEKQAEERGAEKIIQQLKEAGKL